MFIQDLPKTMSKLQLERKEQDISIKELQIKIAQKDSEIQMLYSKVRQLHYVSIFVNHQLIRLS